MPRSPRKVLKRLRAPKPWMLSKLGGCYALKARGGPHKTRSSLPIAVFLQNRLKFTLKHDNREAKIILKGRLVKIDNRVRTSMIFPVGFMDVISIEKIGQYFRVLYDVKGRFTVHRISEEEAGYKLCKVRRKQIGPRGIPYITTHDGRTIRYPDPLIKVNDTVRIDMNNIRIIDHAKFGVGKLCMAIGGRNVGRVGHVIHIEPHAGGYTIVHVKDALDRQFATTVDNVFVIGDNQRLWISLPKHRGIKLTIGEERDSRRFQSN
ncbi:ribosomal family S4e-domain-containing protein [Umbelopsis sp. PMI_123]|nr:ribosomal family S4e-domain-containing protein [Umbelopsis sp. PMI_123]